MPSRSDKKADFVIGALEEFECSLTRYAARLLNGDLERARDVVQHAFLKLCEQDHKKVKKKLAPWLYKVCRNRAIDEIRVRELQGQMETRQLDELNGTSRDPLVTVEDAEIKGKLQQLIDRLPRSEREIVELWSQGFSNAEMAEIAGVSDGAVRVRLHRAITQLKQNASVRHWLSDNSLGRSISSPLSNR